MNGAPLRGRVSNFGDVDVSALEITLSGQVAAENRSRSFVLELLPIGASVDASFSCAPWRQARRCRSILISLTAGLAAAITAP